MLFFSLLAISCEAPTPRTLHVVDAWTRPYQAARGITTAIYLTIDNPTESSFHLTGASIASADTVEIHRSRQENGIMRMEPVSGMEIPRTARVLFQPGGNHLMVKGLRRDLAEGDSLDITLYLEEENKIEARAAVRWDN